MNEFEKTYNEIMSKMTRGYWTDTDIAKDTLKALLLIAKELHELNKKEN